jgi:Holliday junction resolvasome RuvABC endonuclease subunit
MNYIYGFDLSMACVGLSIFTDDGKCVLVTSIETKNGDSHAMKLKYIGDEILKIKEKYPTKIIAIEKGFSKFNLSTQVVFRVHGLISYLFYECEQIYYEATKVKKFISGKGNAKKDELMNIVSKKYPNIQFNNFDESDSFCVGLCYLYKNDILKGEF